MARRPAERVFVKSHQYKIIQTYTALSDLRRRLVIYFVTVIAPLSANQTGYRNYAADNFRNPLLTLVDIVI